MLGLASAGVGLLSSGIGALAGNYQLNKQIKYQEQAQQRQNEANLRLTQEYNKGQMDLAKFQNDYNTEMWNKQNEYNSPEATMQRLTEAGINPRAYQQIGQFANAGTPAPSASPEQKMAEYTDPKLSSTQLRMQKLAINNAFTEQRIRAVELGSHLFESIEKRKEQKRHNEEMEELTRNRDWNNFDLKNRSLIIEEDKFRSELAKVGIKYNEQTRDFKIPDWILQLPKQEAYSRLSNLIEQTKKVIAEREYLMQKGELDVDKHQFEKATRWYTKILDTIEAFMPG